MSKTDRPTSRFKPKPEDLCRPFWYPPDANEHNGIVFTLRYLSPNVYSELIDQIRARFSVNGKRQSDLPPATLQREVTNEVLLHAVVKGEGATFKKLSAIVPLNAEEVRKAGGPDAPVPLDPSVPGSAQQARDWLLYLLEESSNFSNWALNACQNIGAFQDNDWEERAKNSVSGLPTNVANPPSETSPASA